jgi:putative transposase
VFGPLWQGRYKAKLVDDQRYLDQLLVYIHLNPVTAGVVDEPALYRWSGHCEILGRVKRPVVDVDEVLRVFGTTRRTARARYVRTLKGAVEDDWIGEMPGQLPWWRLGRPPKGEDEDPEDAVRERRRREVEGPAWRPRMTAEELVTRGGAMLGVEIEDLRSRRRTPELVRARELLVAVGVERYRLKVKDMADAVEKSPVGMSDALARATRRRVEDEGFKTDLDDLDRALSDEKG